MEEPYSSLDRLTILSRACRSTVDMDILGGIKCKM